MHKQKILIYIDNLERLFFYQKIMSSYGASQFIVITNKLSVYLKIKPLLQVCLLTRNTKEHKLKIDCNRTLSVRGGYHPVSRCEDISNSVLNALDTTFANEDIGLVLVWNGTTTIGYTIGEYCRQNHIPVKFLELSNLPGKIFADVLGVNAASKLYQSPTMLDCMDVPETEYEAWKSVYLQSRQNVPKQAANRSKIRFAMIYDYIGYYVLGYLREDYRNPIIRIWHKLKNKKMTCSPKIDLSKEFFFFPLQVSNDSQILLNSDVDNIQAIEMIRSKYPSHAIVAKIHPAEENREFVKKIEKMQDQYFVLAGNDTRELIQKASKVITINSTVGLEALIYGKEVEVLGRAIYAQFDHQRLKAYICRYLINTDYFDNEVAEKEVVRLLDE